MRLYGCSLTIAELLATGYIMHTLSQVSAKTYSTFRFQQTLSELTELSSIQDLELYNPTATPIILGEGSNTIFLQNIEKPICRYIAAEKQLLSLDSNYAALHVEAGHNWHELVSWCVDNGWWGIENLALIPGSVGAAPVQNIGAYGVELADRCLYVDFFHWHSKKVQRITGARCNFTYRDSIFKQALAGKGIIVAVGILVQREGVPVLTYSGLDNLTENPSLAEIYTSVINIRQTKLPSPTKLANCGSFFKNPIISAEQYTNLQKCFPTIPGYTIDDNLIKVPTAWLLEQQGFKGFKQGDVGCYEKQPLVLVNFGDGTADQLIALISLIIETIDSHYNIRLEPEVRLLTKEGSLYGE